MADVDAPCPSSPSESDSDSEPNSRGARVFWGSLRTPEKSRSAFVHPPHTVVRTQRAMHIQPAPTSAALFMSPEDGSSSPDAIQVVDRIDEPPDQAHSNSGVIDLVQAHERHDMAPPHSHSPDDDDNSGRSPRHRQTPSHIHAMSPQPHTAKISSGSESEIEREPVLQSSSPLHTLSPLDLSAQQPSDTVRQISSPATHMAVAPCTEPLITPDPRPPRLSELPDLISFDIPTPPQHTLPHPQPHPSSPIPPSQLCSSSSTATVDDLLSLSPVQSKSPLLHSHVLEPQPTGQGQEEAVTAFKSTPDPQVSHQEGVERCSDELAVATDPAPPQTTTLTSPIGASPLQHNSTNSGDISTAHPSTAEDRPTTPVFKVLDEVMTHTPKPSLNPLPSTSRGETRKRSPAKGSKGKEKAHDGDNNASESSSNTSGECIGSLRNDSESAGDKTKKERREKMKREAERTRQQLLSLSPTSANLLSLLASPDRGSPPRPLIGLDGAVSDLAMDSDPPSGSTYIQPSTPRMNAARRVPISASPRRSEASPRRRVAPGPVNLNDPNRTPARRIPVPFDARTPRPLPIDDPNRTPARRVTLHTSPERPAELTELPASRIRIEESSPIKQTMLSPAKSSTHPTSSKFLNNTTSLSSASTSPTISVPKPLPFPIQQNVARGNTVESTSVRTSRPNADTGTATQASASNLRQPSSISTSKIARITTKPYSRPVHGPSRLPLTSSLRGALSTADPSSASVANGGGLSRPHSAAKPAPSRIPSPSKRPPPFVKPPIDAPASAPTPASTSAGVNSAEDKTHAITNYKRKRQRMISEDDPDEPPAKRAVIMVRPVIKGMYNKGSTTLDAAESTTLQREASPVRPLRPPGPIQVRPVIPGTLRHFETTRSSSRDLLNDSEQDNNSDTRTTATGLSETVTQLLSESREESPWVDTDTASTVTTLSREPTEDLPDLSTPHSEPPVPTESGPELRRTTRVRKKPYGPDSLGVPGASTAACRRDRMALTRTTSMIQRGGPLSSKGSSRSTTRTGVPQEGLPINPRQLQALTDANTLRNQTYLADLQRKVVRRYGPRPASPTTKVRSIMEKSREERSKEREARAERRRRRDQGSNMSASSEGDFMDVLSSPISEKQPSENCLLTKHARGPGDEVDYETPVRPPQATHVDPSKVAKTVKWDRGLARTISDWAAEQIAIEAHEGAKSEAIRKGCLIRDRTTLRLDPLGNVPDANVPLEHVERERVVVTRFVYDDDIEATRAARKKT